MRFRNDTDQYKKIKFSLHEGTQQIIAKINEIVNKDLESFSPTNVDFNFLQYNLFNEYEMY